MTLLVSGATAWVLYEVARDQGIADLRQRLGDIVAVAAVTVDGDLHSRITPELGMDSAPYQQVQGILQQIRDGASDLHFVYTMRLDADGAIRFVVDAEEDPVELAVLGSQYEEASPLLREQIATMTAPVVESDLYSDRWGTWLSGYAPIRAADGTQVAVLGADISAATLKAYEQRLLAMAVAVFAATVPLILLIGWWAGRTIARPILALKLGAERLAGGDLSTRLGMVRRDEIGALADAFDRMAANLADGRRRIEEAAAKYRSIFDNATEGIFRTTLDGRILDANPALLAMLGYQDLAQAQRTIHDLGAQVYVNPDDRRALVAQLHATGRVEGCETQLKRVDGTTLWAELSLHQVDQGPGEAPILEGMVLDVTERRRRQQAEREREAAQAASQAKSGFLANMSHEIRTPLNAILGLTDLALRTDLDPRQRDYLTKVKSASATLLAVINDILDLSKIEAGRLDLESTAFSLDEILANLTEMFAFRAHERDIELIVSAHPEVARALIGDPVRFGQILINLTGNAIKFTERGEVAVTIELDEATAAPSNEDQIRLRCVVRDTGPGIAAERLAAILEPFAQADESITRRHGGTGLGLAIVRHLTESMGGTITVESQPGQGSTFTATLVLRRQPDRRDPRPATPIDLRGLRVLIVDDNATAREILTGQIRSFQMEATAVGSGEAALALLADPARRFDLVLLDWKMPGLNGLETAQRIRRDLKLDRTPVVCMISAYAREDLMQRSERSTLDAFLHKPIDQSFLFDTIMALFGHQGAQPITQQVQRAGGDVVEPPDLSGQRVLLVEDIEINRLVAIEWLEAAGLAVDTAENGAEALAKADPARHAAVLMDLQMPVMDGLEATRRLRATAGCESLPIIAMTAHALKGDLERGLAAGMNDYLTKPIDPAKLFATLARWIPSATSPARTRQPSPTPAEQELDLDLPGIDTADGLRRANGNRGLYLRLLHGFASDLRAVVGTTEAHLAAGRFDEGRRAVHSIKGVAGNLGAIGLYDRAAAAEDQLASGTFDPGSPIWRGFVATVAEVREGLARLPSSSADDAATVPVTGDRRLSRAEIDEALVALRSQLDDDLDSARARLAHLSAALEQCFGTTLSHELRTQIAEFEIDAAIDTIDRMRESLGPDDGTG
ncbi:response regulator [Thioalkalicoccus limnaeus]|uniref:histidine kinase n=1 Tax=Thioalkalicoccus limnaeus TaxID=120681 RepID=A0ABV4BGW3_9GAMM